MSIAKGSITDWISDRILRAIIGIAKALPYQTRVRFFGAAVEGVIAPLAGYRKRARAQLAMIYPEMAHDQRHRIARAVCNNFGRTFIENYSRAGFFKQLESAKITGPGLPALAEAKAAGRPVLFVTGHFGNFEAPRVALTQMGYKIGGLYRPMSNPYFNAHYEQSMMGLSGDVFPQGHRGTGRFFRMLKRGGMGALLFDVRATAFDDIDFLGHPAPTSTAAADFALRLNALVIPYFGIRQQDGLSFEVVIDAPIPLTDTQTMMREMTDRLETQIRAYPEQWFWVHKRWG